MDLPMFTNGKVRTLPLCDQYFEYAMGYLAAAKTLNKRAIELATSCQWTDSTVVLMCACHAVEMFLKAAIMKIDPEANLFKEGHDIHALALKYEGLQQNESLHFQVPFRRIKAKDIAALEALLGEPLTSDQVGRLNRASEQFSIENRYPVNKYGEPWGAIQGHKPLAYAGELDELESTFKSVWIQLP